MRLCVGRAAFAGVWQAERGSLPQLLGEKKQFDITDALEGVSKIQSGIDYCIFVKKSEAF